MKEEIQKRMNELMEEGKKLETQIHMINGALQQCQWQLAELDKKQPAEPTEG
jgi:predicted  nucleic acid-binding Zn-ribbon protein